MRYAFDQFEVPFDLIYKERVKQGNLRAAYDVIVIPNQGRGGEGPGLRHRAAGRQAAGVHQDPTSSRTWACTVDRTTSPAAWASKAWSSSTNSWKRAAC